MTSETTGFLTPESVLYHARVTGFALFGLAHLACLAASPVLVAALLARYLCLPAGLVGPRRTMLLSLSGVAATFTLLYNASLMVEEGLGLAITFDGIVRAGEGTPFAVVPLADLVPQRSRLIWKRSQPLTRASELFLKTMREQASRGAEKGGTPNCP